MKKAKAKTGKRKKPRTRRASFEKAMERMLTNGRAAIKDISKARKELVADLIARKVKE